MITFVVHSANTPGDYMDFLFLFTISFAVLVCYISTVFEMTKLFDFFDDCEKIFVKSTYVLRITAWNTFIVYFLKQIPSKSEYPEQKEKLVETKRLAELLNDVVHFLMVKVFILGEIVPKAILSFYKYHTTDASSDAFELSYAVRSVVSSLKSNEFSCGLIASI